MRFYSLYKYTQKTKKKQEKKLFIEKNYFLYEQVSEIACNNQSL